MYVYIFRFFFSDHKKTGPTNLFWKISRKQFANRKKKPLCQYPGFLPVLRTRTALLKLNRCTLSLRRLFSKVFRSCYRSRTPVGKPTVPSHYLVRTLVQKRDGVRTPYRTWEYAIHSIVLLARV